jgi:drug/metabolite transporter (DMT)-like permease
MEVELQSNSAESMKGKSAGYSARSAQVITLIAAFFWGTSFVVIELGLEIINPFWFAQFRFFIATLGALIVVLAFKKTIGKHLILSHWVWILGFFNALGFLAQFTAQTTTNATKTALLVNLNLITVAFLSIIIFKERFSSKKIFAVILSILGVFLLTTDGDLSKLTSGEFRGDIFAIGAGFFWAFYIVSNKKVITNKKIDIIPLTACVMLTTTIIMVPFTIVLGGLRPEVLNIGLKGVGFIVYMGICCNVIPFILWTYGLRRLMPTVSTLMLLFEIFIAAVLAMLILNEFLTIIGIIGGFVIIAAIIIISLDSRNNKNNQNIKRNNHINNQNNK